MANLYENYNVGDDLAAWFSAAGWAGQTFTVGTVGHTVTSIKVKLCKAGNPGTLTASIRATDSSGMPTGPDLATGTLDANTLTTSQLGAWYEIFMSPEITLAPNTKYAIIMRIPNGDYTDNLVARLIDSTTPTYTAGQFVNSQDSGATWSSPWTDYDIMFEVWGNAAAGGTPPPPTGTNLEPIPNAWGLPSYAHIDNSTLHNGNVSLAEGAGIANTEREIDGTWLNVKPGDHIIFKVWVKCAPSGDPSDVPPTDNEPGAQVGMDFYINPPEGFGRAYKGGTSWDNALTEPANSGLPLGPNDKMINSWWVPYGSDWTQVGWDIIVPSDFCDYVYHNGFIKLANPIQVSSLVPWLAARGFTNPALVWFADAELYINPSTTPPPPPVQYVLDIWKINGGTTTPTGSQTVNSGTVVTINAVASDGYTFGGWLVNGVSHPVTENPLSVTVTAAMTVIPIFNAIMPSKVNLTITVTGQGTTNPAAGNYVNVYNVGDQLYISATEATGWQYQKMRRNGVDWTTANPGEFLNLQATETIEVVFISTVTPPPPSQAGSAIPFLLLGGGVIVAGLVLSLMSGKKRTQPRPERKVGTYTKTTTITKKEHR